MIYHRHITLGYILRKYKLMHINYTSYIFKLTDLSSPMNYEQVQTSCLKT